jgi:hypothetical protein
MKKFFQPIVYRQDPPALKAAEATLLSSPVANDSAITSAETSNT